MAGLAPGNTDRNLPALISAGCASIRAVMSLIFKNVALSLLFSGVCLTQSLTPPEALDRYLSAARDQAECSALVYAVQIDASLPKLRRQGSMSGLKLVSKTGRIAYRGLLFTGDNLVKTAVITRFLAHEAEPPAPAGATAMTRQNYSFVYDQTEDYNGSPAYVYHLKPKRKRKGLFEGELWLDAACAAPLRLWGDLVKSPSLFIRTFRFVQDYQCSKPVRLLVTVQTRLVGKAELAEWLHPVDSALAIAETGAMLF